MQPELTGPGVRTRFTVTAAAATAAAEPFRDERYCDEHPARTEYHQHDDDAWKR